MPIFATPFCAERLPTSPLGGPRTSIRRLLALGKDRLTKEGARALAARAATLVTPDAKLGKDAPELISAMLAGGWRACAT